MGNSMKTVNINLKEGAKQQLDKWLKKHGPILQLKI
jgi:hypothetical protein